MIYDIDTLFEMLSWNSSAEVQKKGIEEACKIKHLSIFLQPIESKETWENCAKVLVSKENHELQRYLLSMFEWLRDMNWPGADLIYDRLKSMPPEFIKCAYLCSVKMAILQNDFPWQQILDTFNISS